MDPKQKELAYEYMKNTASHCPHSPLPLFPRSLCLCAVVCCADEASAISLVDNVQVSTLLLHAVDDPVVSYRHVDWDRCQGSRAGLWSFLLGRGAAVYHTSL